jgi:hypothetical protein
LTAGDFSHYTRREQQLRFAVHGHGTPAASPRSHGMPVLIIAVGERQREVTW